jgi:hypothetical protein
MACKYGMNLGRRTEVRITQVNCASFAALVGASAKRLWIMFSANFRDDPTVATLPIVPIATKAGAVDTIGVLSGGSPNLRLSLEDHGTLITYPFFVGTLSGASQPTLVFIVEGILTSDPDIQ